MKTNFIKIIKLHPYTAIIFYAILTIRNVIKFKFFKTNLKTGHRKNNTNNILKYINFCTQSVFNQIPNNKRKGTALEIGPGDNNGLALALLCNGFKKVDLIDRYQILKNDHENYSLYEKICQDFDLEFSEIRYDERIMRLLHLRPNSKKYDLIYSVSVLEHLWPFWENLNLYASNLSEDGVMIHIVNFTDHGMFSPQSNRFYFRKIPAWVYDPIMSPVGRPNRLLPSEMCAMITELGFKIELQVIRTHTRILNAEEKYGIDSIPLDELREIVQCNPSLSNEEQKICDQAIGSAIIIAYR